MLPKCVVFDMDGVIVDTADAHYASWCALANEHDVRIARDEFLRTFGRPSREIIRLRFGTHLSDETVRRMDNQKESHFRELARDHVKLLPHATELIEELSERGVALAIGSSAPPENVKLILDLFNLHKHFKVLVTGQDVTRGKPDPEVFLVAARRLGLAPADCVVIEDAPAGIEAARNAGMTAIALTSSHSSCAFGRAHRVVSSLGELRPDDLLVSQP